MIWMMPSQREEFLEALEHQRWKLTMACSYNRLVLTGALPPREAYHVARVKVWERAVNDRESRLHNRKWQAPDSSTRWLCE